mgnify:CR=1 FL=1
MKNEYRETEETTDKCRVILRQTENIETVMGLIKVEPQPQINPHSNCALREVSGFQASTLMLLWFSVLLAQMLMFWRVKKRG